MTKKSKPTRKEVLKEMGRTVFNEKTGKYFKKALDTNLAVYNIPSVVVNDKADYKTNALGMIGLGFQGAIYAELISKGVPAYLLPAVTNALSGIYEAGKYIYNKAEQRVIDNKKSKLEGKLKK